MLLRNRSNQYGAAFNLSILECKFGQGVVSVADNPTFNLSILECKCQQTEPGRDYLETFNLSILECKYISENLNEYKITHF